MYFPLCEKKLFEAALGKEAVPTFAHSLKPKEESQLCKHGSQTLVSLSAFHLVESLHMDDA